MSEYMQGIVVRWLRPSSLDREILVRVSVAEAWGGFLVLGLVCALSTQEWMGAWLDSDCLSVWMVASKVTVLAH